LSSPASGTIAVIEARDIFTLSVSAILTHDRAAVLDLRDGSVDPSRGEHLVALLQALEHLLRLLLLFAHRRDDDEPEDAHDEQHGHEAEEGLNGRGRRRRLEKPRNHGSNLPLFA
jgi:hypothetical protein